MPLPTIWELTATPATVTSSAPSAFALSLSAVRRKYLSAIQSLLPLGSAWTRETGAELTDLVTALTVEFERISDRGDDLADECIPGTISELLTEWETICGLTPPAGATDAARNDAIAGALFGMGGDPNEAFFVALAAAMGYAITITTYHDPFTAISDCTDSVEYGYWPFHWTVTTASGAADDELEALFEVMKPAHTTVDFVFT